MRTWIKDKEAPEKVMFIGWIINRIYPNGVAMVMGREDDEYYVYTPSGNVEAPEPAYWTPLFPDDWDDEPKRRRHRRVQLGN